MTDREFLEFSDFWLPKILMLITILEVILFMVAIWIFLYW
jgi:hypothetical protein